MPQRVVERPLRVHSATREGTTATAWLSPIIFLRVVLGSLQGCLWASQGLGMLRVISACWVPRSTRSVVIWG